MEAQRGDVPYQDADSAGPGHGGLLPASGPGGAAKALHEPRLSSFIPDVASGRQNKWAVTPIS